MTVISMAIVMVFGISIVTSPDSYACSVDKYIHQPLYGYVFMWIVLQNLDYFMHFRRFPLRAYIPPLFGIFSFPSHIILVPDQDFNSLFVFTL